MKKLFEAMKEFKNGKKGEIEEITNYARKHPYLFQFLIWIGLSILAAFLFSCLAAVGDMAHGFKIGEVVRIFLVGVIFGTLVFSIPIFPLIVTGYEVLVFWGAMKKGQARKEEIEKDGYEMAPIHSVGGMLYDFFVIFAGVFLEIIVLTQLYEVDFFAQWSDQLKNLQLHTPINVEHMFSFVVISSLYVLGILVLTLTQGKKRAPLVTVLCISAMYIGVLESILFHIQLMGIHTLTSSGETLSRFSPAIVCTLLIPINMILVMLRVMLAEIRTYEPDENRNSKIEKIPVLRWCNKILCNSKTWPVAALFMMLPILGIVIGILTLLGQAPDAAIKAFTETADYAFSTKIPPQNIYYDEHYLCTVAAGGHRKIVKPIRMGKRHGHPVVVNRQLMIANAFEQILEEKIPKVHKPIRKFYDTYGFPVARIIKTKFVADLIWLIMKPLEWIFLIVIYLVDVHPEDRIARQYL